MKPLGYAAIFILAAPFFLVGCIFGAMRVGFEAGNEFVEDKVVAAGRAQQKRRDAALSTSDRVSEK